MKRLLFFILLLVLSTSAFAAYKINPDTGKRDYYESSQPGGSNTQVQYNDSGVLAGDANLTYNKSSGTLLATNLGAVTSVTAPVIINGIDSATNNLVLDGDSLTVGTGGTNPYSFYMTSLRQTFTIVNQGQGADRMSGLLQYASSQVDPLYNRKAAYNVIIVWAGTNDFVYSATPAEVYQYLVAYVKGRQRVGYKVIVGTMISRTGLETQKNAYNKLIRDNYLSFADGIADFAENSNIGADNACNNTTYFDADKTHLNDTGYSLVGGIAQTAVNKLTDMVPASWSGTKSPIVIGRKTGSTLYSSSADGLIFIGDNTGSLNTASSSYDLVCIGSGSCVDPHGHSTVAVGNTALSLAPNVNYTTAIGDGAMRNSLGTLTNNTVIGSVAGEQLNYTNNGVSNQNVVLGSTAARYVGDASRNVIIGDDAWERGVAGDDNTLIGFKTGFNGGWSSDSNFNTSLGSESLQGITTADKNIAIGYKAANTTTTGDNNIIIGNEVSAPSATTSSYLNLANVLYSDDADSTGTTPSTGKIGLGVAPDSTNAVNLAGPTMIQSGGSANNAVCWKSDGKTLGYCSDTPNSNGDCTCN